MSTVQAVGPHHARYLVQVDGYLLQTGGFGLFSFMFARLHTHEVFDCYRLEKTTKLSGFDYLPCAIQFPEWLMIDHLMKGHDAPWEQAKQMVEQARS